jgi:hypothetical protein
MISELTCKKFGLCVVDAIFIRLLKLCSSNLGAPSSLRTPVLAFEFSSPSAPIGLPVTSGAQQRTRSIQRFPKRQIQPAPSGQRMIAVGKRIYSMKRQPGWTAPYDDIAAF